MVDDEQYHGIHVHPVNYRSQWQ